MFQSSFLPKNLNWTGSIDFKCGDAQNIAQPIHSNSITLNQHTNIESIEIYLDKDKKQKINSDLIKNGLNAKKLFVDLKCKNSLKRNELTLKLLENKGYFILLNNSSNIVILTSILPYENETCIEDSFSNITIANTKILDFSVSATEIRVTKLPHELTSSATIKNIVNKIYINVKLVSILLVAIVAILLIGLILVFILFKSRAKKDDRLSFVDSSANFSCKNEKKEIFTEWKNKLINGSNGCAGNSMNTIDTRASMVSNGGDFLTIRSKHSINEDYFYNDVEELKVNDRPDEELRKQAQAADGLFAFSDGYLNELGINMMDNLRNIAINSKISENDAENESKCEANNFSTNTNTFASTSFNKQGCLDTTLNTNEKFEYMDVGFYKWCKLLDWKLEYSDLSNVLDDLIKLD